MLNSTVLEVAIGLTFCYASIALITSSIFEALSSWLNFRAKILFDGVADLLNAKRAKEQADVKQEQDILNKIYNNALVHPVGSGEATDFRDYKSLPSYIEPKNFALALIQSIQQIPGQFDTLDTDIRAIKNRQLRSLLQGLYVKSEGDIVQFEEEIAHWFEAGMVRVSYVYKKWSQLLCFIIALFIAVIFNIDSVHLFKTLWLQPTIISQLSNETLNPLLATQALGQLSVLPLGWNNAFSWSAFLDPFHLVGWLLTASASLFGAPFWFDILNSLVRVRDSAKNARAKAS